MSSWWNLHPEDGRRMLVRNVGILTQNYMASQPRRPQKKREARAHCVTSRYSSCVLMWATNQLSLGAVADLWKPYECMAIVDIMSKTVTWLEAAAIYELEIRNVFHFLSLQFISQRHSLRKRRTTNRLLNTSLNKAPFMRLHSLKFSGHKTK